MDIKIFLLASLSLLTRSGAASILGAEPLLGNYFGVANGPGNEFDYIVVGGGTAGLTIANRLAENGSYSVAVVEAGGFYEIENGNISTVPGLGGSSVGSDPIGVNPLSDWGIRTTPQAGLGGRSSFYVSGRMLGGSSAANFLWYHRGSKGAYQKWADLVGDQSYGWENFLPFFKKSVTFSPPTTFPRPENATAQYAPEAFSPEGGPVHVSYPKWVWASSSWMSRLWKAVGLPQARGFTDGDVLGYSYIGLLIDPATETRSSSQAAHLTQALWNRANIQVFTQTLAKKILFDDNKKATSVLVQSGSTQYILCARKEIVISSGVFRSPQLLLVSGIGPSDTLAGLGIPLIADRPGVGQKMWDHVLFGSTRQINVVTTGSLQHPGFAEEQAYLYDHNRTGFYTAGGGDFLAFDNLPSGSLSNQTEHDLRSQFPEDWPTNEYFMLNGYGGNLRDLHGGAPLDGKQYGTLCAAMVAPFSRGNVTISSNDTAINPVVNPNWLSDPRDQEVALASFKQVRRVLTNEAVQPLLIGQEVYPGLNVSSDAEIIRAIQDMALPVYHAAGTNAMGKRNDSQAVVDSDCRVIGVDGLRVVDASVFPVLPPGHPTGTIYALAEKIADRILNPHI